jgi:hypothetical protein
MGEDSIPEQVWAGPCFGTLRVARVEPWPTCTSGSRPLRTRSPISPPTTSPRATRLRGGRARTTCIACGSMSATRWRGAARRDAEGDGRPGSRVRAQQRGVGESLCELGEGRPQGARGRRVRPHGWSGGGCSEVCTGVCTRCAFVALLAYLTHATMRFSRNQAGEGGAYGIRTRATAVRGRRPRPLDECARRGTG